MTIPEMHLQNFTRQTDFPFFIQYGHHDESMFLHSHADFTELVFVLGGSAMHLVNGEEYPVKKRDVFVISENTSHGFLHANHFRICNIMFQPEFFFREFGDVKALPGFHTLFVIDPALTAQRGFRARRSLAPDDFDYFDRLINDLHREYVSHPAGYQTMVSGLFLQMITRLSRLSNDNIQSAQSSAASLANAVAYLEYHFRDDLSMEDLAQMAGMSARHFRRVFHDIYGTSPLRYLHTLRIQSAARLLLGTDLTVTEIAIRSGYADGNYFSEKFRQMMGVAPLEYRRGNHG